MLFDFRINQAQVPDPIPPDDVGSFEQDPQEHRANRTGYQ